MNIIPDYLRYTEFTLDDRLTLAHLCEQRLISVTKFLVAKSEYQRMLAAQGHQQEIATARAHLECWLDIIGEIDEAIFRIYHEHGRLN